MAITACVHCGHTPLAEDALRCPHCGGTGPAHAAERERSNRRWTHIGGLLSLIALILFVLMVRGCS